MNTIAFDDNNVSTTAAAISVPQYQAPIPLSSKKYLFTQEWQGPDTFAPVALNTPHPDGALSAYILVAEGPRQAIGGNQVRWTRTYAIVPDTYSLPEYFPYNFIGFFGSYFLSDTTIPTGRNRFPNSVPSRIQHDYFLVDPAGDNVTVFTTPFNIPIIQAQKYRLFQDGTTWWMDMDWLSNSPPFNKATTPNRSTYESYMINAAKFGWQSGIVVYNWGVDGTGVPTVNTTGTGANPGQICAEDSRLDLWIGNIFLRRTRFILAQ